MQVTVIGVGKYKEKFKQTGLLINDGATEFWCNFPGNLGWKQYKDKQINVDVAQNRDGYWEGTIAGPHPQQPSSRAPQGNRGPHQPSGNKDRLIVTQVVYKALVVEGQCDEENLIRDVDMIMRVGSGQPNPDYVGDDPPPPVDDEVPF